MYFLEVMVGYMSIITFDVQIRNLSTGKNPTSFTGKPDDLLYCRQQRPSGIKMNQDKKQNLSPSW